MLWMETYLSCFSVRLGLIVVAALGLVRVFIAAILLISMGMDALDPIIKLFKNDDEYGKMLTVQTTLNWIENHSQAFIATLLTSLAIHLICCGLAILGALKLKKWLLLPYIIHEFIRVSFYFAAHIILMIILKKKLNLGLLIAVTLLGGFILLYLAYNWATSVALFQIIELVHTERYRKLYGDDPFHPQLPPNYSYTSPPQYSYGTVENVRVLVTPRSGDIDEQKQRQTQRTAVKAPTQPVIAVLPANYVNNNGPHLQSKQMNSFQQQQQYQRSEKEQNEYNAEFGNWQWSELMVGRQRKALL
ncbi:uncharacterized protein LOC129248356 [Anastrepha obliqua]|uniref:uncharacterized protein LOC129248356 n=1 Tax=Anastrepha obliqua TaxID=95512 RepID=UPI002408FFC3|nr:uncharacterized protein LOC129248356 [Anastrepha obliqua]